jgi:hypothetical protein
LPRERDDLAALPGQGHHERGLERLRIADGAGHVVAIEVGKSEVEEDHRVAMQVPGVDRVAAIVDDLSVMPRDLEQERERLRRLDVVIHHQYFRHRIVLSATHVAFAVPRFRRRLGGRKIIRCGT